MSSESKLEPCPNPWCSSTTLPLPVRFTAWRDSAWRVACGCGVQTPRTETQAEAISAWNRRSPPIGEGEPTLREQLDALGYHKVFWAIANAVKTHGDAINISVEKLITALAGPRDPAENPAAVAVARAEGEATCAGKETRDELDLLSSEAEDGREP